MIYSCHSLEHYQQIKLLHGPVQDTLPQGIIIYNDFRILPLSNFGRKSYDCMKLTRHALSAICEFLVTMYVLLGTISIKKHKVGYIIMYVYMYMYMHVPHYVASAMHACT